MRATVTFAGTEIVIELDDEALIRLQEVARKREMSMEDIVVEALKLEQLLADSKLIMMTPSGSFQRLVSA